MYIRVVSSDEMYCSLTVFLLLREIFDALPNFRVYEEAVRLSSKRMCAKQIPKERNGKIISVAFVRRTCCIR